MFFGCFAWLLLGKTVYFPAQPLPLELREGARLYEQHKGIERTYMEDREEVGRWFDGHAKRDVESVLWLSPGMASRRLGYLQAKEKWSDETLRARWRAAAQSLNGRLVFVVRLSAYPRLGGLDMEPVSKANPAEVRDVRFLFTSGPGLPETHEKSAVPWDENLRISEYEMADPPPVVEPLKVEPRVELLASWQARERNALDRFDWAFAGDWAEPFRGEFDKPTGAAPYPFGDYYAAWYLVTVELESQSLHPLGFDLRVFSPEKERIAHFSLLPSRR